MFNVGAHQINPILALARIFCTRHVIDVFFVIESPITKGKIIFRMSQRARNLTRALIHVGAGARF